MDSETLLNDIKVQCEMSIYKLQQLLNYCSGNEYNSKDLFEIFCNPSFSSLINYFKSELSFEQCDDLNNLIRMIEEDALPYFKSICDHYKFECQPKESESNAFEDRLLITSNHEAIYDFDLFQRCLTRRYNESLLNGLNELKAIRKTILVKDNEMDKISKSIQYSENSDKVKTLLNRTLRIKSLRKRYKSLHNEREDLSRDLYLNYSHLINEKESYLLSHLSMIDFENQMFEIKKLQLFDPLKDAELQSILNLNNENYFQNTCVY